jgi:hypothetical protein
MPHSDPPTWRASGADLPSLAALAVGLRDAGLLPTGLEPVQRTKLIDPFCAHDVSRRPASPIQLADGTPFHGRLG